MDQHSEECCKIPPIVVKDFQPKGEYTTVDGLKTYATGSADAKHGIMMVYDIFGFFPQTVQGADILAYADNDRSYRVFMPDYFEGSPADVSWYPPATSEHKEKLGAFFEGPAKPEKTAARLPKVLEALRKENPQIESWGVVGYCWGGKIVSRLCCKGDLFKAAAECHPAFIDPDDAKEVKIPIAILASKDEDVEAVKAFEANLKVKNHVETFSDQPHGWMAARADFEDARAKSEYERGYKILVTFFHEHL